MTDPSLYWASTQANPDKPKVVVLRLFKMRLPAPSGERGPCNPPRMSAPHAVPDEAQGIGNRTS
jgi:hypothetical protein